MWVYAGFMAPYTLPYWQYLPCCEQDIADITPSNHIRRVVKKNYLEMRVNMTSILAVIAASARGRVAAFSTPRSKIPTAARVGCMQRLQTFSDLDVLYNPRSCRSFGHVFCPIKSLVVRHMATGPMPYDDDKMPIYALGMNIGLQISQQVSAVRRFGHEATNHR